MLLSLVAKRRVCLGLARANAWRWLMGLVVAFGLVVVHAHLPAAGSLDRDLAAASATLTEHGPIDRVDQPSEAAPDVELFAFGTGCTDLPRLAGDTVCTAPFSSRTVLPSERPPRRNRSRA